MPKSSTQDGAATLTALTVAAVVAAATSLLPRPPASWIAAGGGTRNPTLMRMLEERLAPASVETADAVGWSADALEAQAFAYLAVRSLRGLADHIPGHDGRVPADARRRTCATCLTRFGNGANYAAGLRSVLRRLSR